MEQSSYNHCKPKVLVTGFGLFAGYSVNPSWEAVKNMNKEAIERKHDCELIIMEIPVSYKLVDEIIPELWKTYNPKLMIHTGVNYLAQCLNIETQSFKYGYGLPDCMSYHPTDYTCPINGPPIIDTNLDVQGICKEINDNTLYGNIAAISSNDPGRYLCGYIYYTSLAIDSSRTLFVHVPELDVYRAERSARGLEKMLDICLKQINQYNKN